MPPDPTPRETPRSQTHEDEFIGGVDLGRWHSPAGRALVRSVSFVATTLARLGRWSAANLALVLTAGTGLALAWAFTGVSAEVYDNVVDGDGISVVDQPVLDAAVRLRTPLRSEVVTDFTDLGGEIGMTLIALAVTLGLTWAWRRWTPIVLMVTAAAGSLLITISGKDLTARARPPQALAVPPFETSPSFPSGHTLNATVILGITAYLLVLWLRSPRWRAVTVIVVTLFVVAMGLSRVFLGHHWFTDVVAGWTIGLGWLASVITGHRVKISLDRRQRSGDSTDAPVATAERR